MKRRLLKNREKKVGFFLESPRIAMTCLLAASVALFLSSAGCGSGAPRGQVSSKGATASLSKKVTETTQSVEKNEPEKREETTYTYNPVGKPDPFKPFIQLNPVKESSRRIPLTPLQKYEISQLKLVAILSTSGGSVALVEDAAGKGYFLRKGTSVGQNEGRVTNILKDRVIVEEKYQDVFGHGKTNEISIMLHRPEEGGES